MTTTTCTYCGTSFTAKRSSKRFCSRRCSAKHRIELERTSKGQELATQCKECGIPISAARATKRFCSGSCSAKARAAARKPDAACRYCHKPLDPRSRQRVFCSKACKDADRTPGNRGEPITCEICGTIRPSYVGRQRFCSVPCANESHRRDLAAARLESKAGRPPCIGCGGPVAPERSAKATYCTDECKLRSRRHRAYGLTKVELEVLLAQNEGCGICGTTEWGRGPKGPQVDHDHVTGAVRGILCSNCNNGLGRFRDDPALIRKALAYLTG